MKKGLLSMVTFSFLFVGSSLSVGAVENDKDCGDFGSHEAVLEFWFANGYSEDNDPHGLDRDNDGLACEVSQSEYDSYAASQKDDDTSEEATEESEEGGELPDTASNGPLMMLFGAGLAGAGSLLLFRRKSQNA
ncbi:excalibur calcium-binding domain-containing protein [Planococcus sp. N028]|uniref:Excalibur calcium-binding domain-containing protein n=1 Tax=Planococcus shixiaomingii TaxID=3058393 RepID=A0ABT8N424_9BACL|nr:MULTISPECIES: excalibur calcium-binding domain-containing protein [unclassified Planococcus (in: firmicutes)]MDN7242634.1 excalibur calcium-binding domain-containing protein [Planococcus sp. N028]WKA55733.1 excalibur calcium-binding domain-containing protein [Planococcus sp. N022]